MCIFFGLDIFSSKFQTKQVSLTSSFTMKSILFTSLFLIAQAAAVNPPVADCIGIRVAITDKGLKYVSKTAVPILEKSLSSITIPDVTFDQDGFEGAVHSITCKNFLIDTMTLNANADPAASVALAATNVALSCSASWNYKLKVWPHIPKGERRRSNVAVIIVRIVFISAFLFYCLLLNHSFPTNPNRITNCFKLFSLFTNLQLHCSCVAILIFEQYH